MNKQGFALIKINGWIKNWEEKICLENQGCFY